MSTTDLIEQALDNLVNQFANPMDFLRELVQNAIDAGSPRIEVEVRWQEGEGHLGVVEIDVRDFGQGMDEDVIDSQLTRLFSSAKEGDRTAIGKFGIGFTSVFAIRPDAVRVVTGKHGERWEVLFHRDRSFEKRRFEEPTSGTTITVFKRMRRGRLPELVENARASLVHWCEHAHTPLTFTDRTAAGPAEEGPTALDPFAAFAGPAAGETINQPFLLHDAVLQHTHEADGVTVVIGFCDAPSWSFFSGGLTLLRSTDPGHLGEYEPSFRGLSFKILSPHVGHTLTRDNVIQDAAWHAAMGHAATAALALRQKVLDHLEALVQQGDEEAVVRWHGRLRDDLAREPLQPDRHVLLDPTGAPCSLAELSSRIGVLDEVWAVDPADASLAKALVDADVACVRDAEPTVALVQAALERPVHDARHAFCVCEPLSADVLAEAEHEIIGLASELASRATAGTFRIQACDLGPHSPLLFVEGRGIRGLYRVPENDGLRGLARRQLKRWQTWIGRRDLLVNRQHPHLAALLAHPDRELAAYAMVEALVTADAGFPKSTLQYLRSTAVRRWIPHGS
jgi:hypothetical protein